jgi:23S rRNA pseudouridine2604 synthase
MAFNFMEPKRLNKFISDAGFCSRREADQLIEHERVTVNGKLPEPGTKVTPQDKVRIDGQILQVRQEAPVFLVFNKPAGIATTTDRSVRNNIISALNYPATLQPIGFLDRESEGLLFLTNDSELAHKMTKADNKYEKEYVVTVDKMVTPDFLGKISENGPPVPGGHLRKSAVTKLGPHRFRIILEPGMYHNIKKRCEELGYRVQHLQRVRIDDITPAKLTVGMWRTMTPAEIESIKSKVSGRARRASAASREADENDYDYDEEGFTARRSAAPARTGGTRPGRSAAAGRTAGSKPAGTRQTRSAAGSSGPASKRSTGAGTRRTSASRGPAKGPARGGSAGRAGRNSSPKGRGRG